MVVETGDTVTVEYTGRLEDGTVFDTTDNDVAEEAGLADDDERGFDPLTVDVGSGELIDGFEDALIGLEPGEETSATIPPEQAYGERSEDAVREYEREEFDRLVDGETPETGDVLQTPEGHMAEITEVTESSVRVDFNHRLAGETLNFDIEVVDVE